MDTRKNLFMKFSESVRMAWSIVALLWLIYFVNFILPVDLRVFGIRPRMISGLWGVLWAPFLHANLGHLIANSTALFFLMLLALRFSRRLTLRAVLVIVIISGLGIWLFGARRSVHIGASGVIFGLIGFMLVAGIVRREWQALVVSALVFFLYGGAVQSLWVYIPGVSWSGHFFGFAGGVVSAWQLRRYAR